MQNIKAGNRIRYESINGFCRLGYPAKDEEYTASHNFKAKIAIFKLYWCHT